MIARLLLIAATGWLAACSTSLSGSVSVTSAEAPASVTSAEAPKAPVTVFSDDFDGSNVDPAKWTVFDRLSDQANNEVNCVAPQNVSVSNGLLQIVSKFEDRACGDAAPSKVGSEIGLDLPRTMHYTSGQIQQATPPFLYGTVDVRAKAPGGIGTWPAIWMLGFEWQASQPLTANTVKNQWPQAGWSEIDIAEFWQGERQEVNTTVHYGQPGGLHLQPLPYDATSRFMVYRLQWTPGSLVWSVDAEDGKGFRELYSVSGSERVPNVPMYLVISMAIGGTGGGTPDPASFPQTFAIDYVRITQ
jgi:beta-glucanase (GH16 family)